MKVIAGIDGSPRSSHSLEFVGKLLSPKCDDLCVVFCPPNFKLEGASQYAKDLPEMARNALAESVFKEAEKRLSAEIREVTESRVGIQLPADELLAAAEAEKADLIAVGAHGEPRRLQLFVGGTARHVIHHAQQPILVIRGDRLPETGMKVLVACGPSEVWRDAAEVLRDFSWPAGTSCYLFHVLEAMSEEYCRALTAQTQPSDLRTVLEEYRANVAMQKSRCHERLAADREGLPTLVREAEPVVVQGHTLEEIVEFVNRNAIDLVVVNARQLGPMRRLLGSTTEGLLAQCPCSMLIVHQQS